MPWLTIILALLSFFASKKSGSSNTKALLTAGLVGGATYYTSHETEWGKANLGSLDGVIPVATGVTSDPLLQQPGDAVVKAPIGGDGKTVASSTGVFDVLKSWGATGTAAVIGTGAAAAGVGVFGGKNALLFAALGLGAFLILK